MISRSQVPNPLPWLLLLLLLMVATRLAAVVTATTQADRNAQRLNPPDDEDGASGTEFEIFMLRFGKYFTEVLKKAFISKVVWIHILTPLVSLCSFFKRNIHWKMKQNLFPKAQHSISNSAPITEIPWDLHTESHLCHGPWACTLLFLNLSVKLVTMSTE